MAGDADAPAHHDRAQVGRAANDAADLRARRRLVRVASKGGSDEPPAWYLNLSANPEVEVQVKADRFKARARTASAEEKPALWEKMATEWPAYDEYQRKTDREIPIMVLERAAAG